MYQGYRIKVNGTIIDNMMIKRGTYYSVPTTRVLSSYYDAAGGFHEELSPVKKMEIGFTIREHDAEEHTAIVSAFTGRNVSVEYWNDTTGEYNMGVFRADDLKTSHKYAAGGIRYGEIPVKLKEN
jgi:hypothetical protein